VCDPVLGDNGNLYVPKTFVSVYRHQIIKHCNILTPNQFEAEMLSGMKINSLADAFRVCQWFHATYPRIHTVVITSCTIAAGDAGKDGEQKQQQPQKKSNDKGFIDIIATSTNAAKTRLSPVVSSTGSTINSITDEKKAASRVPHSYYHVRVPKRDVYYSGTGDLTAALLLGFIEKSARLSTALTQCVTAVQAVIARTFAAQSKELRLVQSKRDIEFPSQCELDGVVASVTCELVTPPPPPAAGAVEDKGSDGAEKKSSQ
jgi:pyridoxine kinase